MAVRFKLGYYSPATNDALEREYVGYFPRMTEEEAWMAGRGVWKANKNRLSREKFSVIVGDGQVRAVAEITGVTVHDDRVAVDGQVLAEGPPVRDGWIGRPDPVVNASQNPVGYYDLPEGAEFRERPCGCGCAAISTRDFLPGHDVRAFQDRVRNLFAGSALDFIKWVDVMATEHGVSPLAANTSPVAADADPGGEDDGQEEVGDVVSFGIFDAHTEAGKWV
ncbi:hypothetical protein [Nocardia brevicatena]|uniref:hypothetical protein n=1 Tax=Nocardia brevicatena TaxID=37327 RepID=UPI0002E5911C|nr:hypothetical protein [Nocardia brevicatena]